MSKISLGERMKRYEDVTRLYLMRRNVLIYDDIVRLNDTGFERVYPREQSSGTLPEAHRCR